ncbi:unnamed protein product [Hymenolepis diminuta]|uniref:Uncharacterized protein n=1 Tax=Hymenolepis diminuta TaxID=6216 RepID=A0A564Y5B1_HYMDI|nr:unnamed protein product [Hymenolepis diminuta]
MQSLLANALKTTLIKLVAERDDSIIEIVSSPRIKEIFHSPNPILTKNDFKVTWEERMLKLEAKIADLATFIWQYEY